MAVNVITDIEKELAYWDEAAKDPDVANKYIANVDLGDCLDAIVNSLLAGSILDIGCGIGRLSEAIAENAPACQLHGIDISEKMLELTPKPTKVKYKLCDGRKIPYPDQSFESVYSMLVFQHIDDAAMLGYIKETYRVLKDNGVFRFQFVEGDHDGFVDHNHNLDEVTNWLRDTGFEIANIDKNLVLPQWTWVTGVKTS